MRTRFNWKHEPSQKNSAAGNPVGGVCRLDAVGPRSEDQQTESLPQLQPEWYQLRIDALGATTPQFHSNSPQKVHTT